MSNTSQTDSEFSAGHRNRMVEAAYERKYSGECWSQNHAILIKMSDEALRGEACWNFAP